MGRILLAAILFLAVLPFVAGPVPAQARPQSKAGDQAPIQKPVVTSQIDLQVPGQVSPRYSPDVKAMDEESAGPGVMVKGWMREIDAEWARVWGWQPAKPTTVYLYFDGYRMAEGLGRLLGLSLEKADLRYIANSVHALATEDPQTGGWAVLVNLGRYYGESYWEIDNRSVLIHEYAHVMQMDVAGTAGPTWFKEGMAQLCAFTTVPQALEGTDRLAVTSYMSCNGSLPSLRSLNDTWPQMAAFDAQLSYGMAYFAVKQLAERTGGMTLLEVLRLTAAGHPFEESLERMTGYTLETLDREYRTVPCNAYR